MAFLPGGVEAYLDRSSAYRAATAARQETAVATGGPSAGAPARGSAVERAAKKELDRLERQIARAVEREAKLHTELAASATDYEKLTELGAELSVVEAEKAGLEERWLEVAGALEG
jgi:ABC transport system ATP-binding/permease protein